MRRVLASVIVALSLAAVPVSAAEPEAALLDALSRVPDTQAVREQLLSYVDYRAVEASRAGAAQPTSFAELEALRDTGDLGFRLWMAALNGIHSGSGDLLRSLFRYGAEWPALLGFDFFAVDRELAFGVPPGDGSVLLGDFDADAIGRAFMARGYTRSEVGDRTLWCGPDGCDAGLSVDLQARNPANPFGGAIGRTEPLAVSATDLLSSAAVATIDGMLDAATGRVPSLADDPAYRAALEGFDPDARLIQATLVPGELLAADIAALMLGIGSAEEAEAALAELAATFEPIPAYQLLGIADGATATEQVVTVALVYDQEQDAAIAIDVIPRRLATMDSLRTHMPLRQLLEGRGVTAVEGRVVPSGDGKRAIAAITLRAPLAPNEPDAESDRLTSSSLVYWMLVEMVLGRDTLWLSPELPARG